MQECARGVRPAIDVRSQMTQAFVPNPDPRRYWPHHWAEGQQSVGPERPRTRAPSPEEPGEGPVRRHCRQGARPLPSLAPPRNCASGEIPSHEYPLTRDTLSATAPLARVRVVQHFADPGGGVGPSRGARVGRRPSSWLGSAGPRSSVVGPQVPVAGWPASAVARSRPPARPLITQIGQSAGNRRLRLATSSETQVRVAHGSSA